MLDLIRRENKNASIILLLVDIGDLDVHLFDSFLQVGERAFLVTKRSLVLRSSAIEYGP